MWIYTSKASVWWNKRRSLTFPVGLTIIKNRKKRVNCYQHSVLLRVWVDNTVLSQVTCQRGNCSNLLQVSNRWFSHSSRTTVSNRLARKMASLIKNQILKHLSKFAKNLSHDQIHLSTLKGEGELTNLELNDEVLTELLELPSWLRLTCATCNRVTVRIQWTKLKSVPIYLFLDEVRVEVETCEDLRPTANTTTNK